MKLKVLILHFFCFVCILNAQIPHGIPTKDLQAFWAFSGNANDVSGNNRHGRTNGVTLTKDRYGNDSSAYSFNGYSNYILTDYEGILGNHPRTISFWAIVENIKTGIPVISWGGNGQFPNAGGRFDCCFGGCYVCTPEDKFMGPAIDVSDAGVTFEGHDPVDDGKWHHYVYRFNKKYLKDVEIYQDGRLLTHEPYRFYKNCPINTKRGANVSLGVVFLPGRTPYFKGLLDDIAVYDRMLTSEEINALYTAPDPHKKTDILKWIPPFFVILLFALLITWFIRLRIKKLVTKEKEKIQLEKKWYEQENRVLKAQMDPQFIFNALNSIQQFIIVNDNEKAQLYLSTFAQLIRMQLESNTNESITLAQEIVILEKYLEIESLRFNNAFDHEIIIDKTINAEAIYIPYFLIQPFVESAIHNGLLTKTGYKELTISIEIKDPKTLVCSIEDNGIGRKNFESKELPFKTKSLGVNFVEQRLLIMSKIEKKDYHVKIIDKESEEGTARGTKVVITLPII